MRHEDGKGCEHIKEKEFFKTVPHNEFGHSEQCSGHHHPIDVEETSGTRLLIALGLNLIIPVIQVIAGIFAHSMALVSDATHNFSDFTAVLLSYIAYRIGRRGASLQNTFGYRRAEIIAALQFETEPCGGGTLLCETFVAKTKGKKVDQPNRISINKGNNGSNDQSKAKIGPKTYGYLYHIARMVLGVIFIYASLDKIIHPQAFAQTVFNYQLLPDSFINLTALILPWLELILGCCLIFNRWMAGTSVISITLLAVFMAAILFNLSRGLDISCGCFSTNPEEGSMNRLTLIRDASFLIPAIYLVFMSLFKNNGKNQFEEI